jgi:hypothetical protein
MERLPNNVTSGFGNLSDMPKQSSYVCCWAKSGPSSDAPQGLNMTRISRHPKRPNSLFSSVYGLATARQHRCDGNCEILATAETFGLTVDVTRNGGER